MKKAILSRHSQRSYSGEPLSKEDEQKLLDYIQNEENLKGIHGTSVKFHYLTEFKENMEKISTYGVIKKAPAYLVAVTENTTESLIDCGYIFEKLIIYLESQGIHTCWLGGTFKRSQLNVPLAEGEFIPAISPVGYAAEKKTLTDKLVRGIAKSDKRLPFDSLFFEEDFTQSVKDSALREQLEYVRMGPSASNKQPWRILIDRNDVAHLYLEPTPGYGKGALNYPIQMVDMGIAACHYELAKGKVEFFWQKPEVEGVSDSSQYIISMK